MYRHQITRCRRILYLFIAWTSIHLILNSEVVAQSIRRDTALQFMPANTSIYVSMLRNREQFDAFVNSNAFAKIKSLPFVREGIQKLHEQWEEESNFDPIREFVSASENKRLFELVIDAVSHEIFLGAGEDAALWLDAMNEINQATNAANIQAIGGGNAQEIIATKLLEVLEKNAPRLKMPEQYVGFRISNKEAATAELARLEELLKGLIQEQAPQFADRFERKKIGQTEFLTLRLDGSLIPWEQIPLDEVDLDKDRVQKVIAELKKMTATVCLGVYDDYLLLSSGPDEQHLQRLGQGPLLVDNEKLSALAKADGKRLTGISYISDEFMKVLGSVDRQIDQLADMAKSLLPMTPLPDEMKDKLVKDAQELGQDVKKFLPKPGAMMGYAFLTDHGYEGFAFDWSTNNFLDGSRPLPILRHLGGHPILFYASRAKQVPGMADLQTKWVTRFAGHAEELLSLFGEEDQKELYEKAKKDLAPVLRQLAETNRTKCTPAFADGQSAIVFDAKLTAKQWHMAMPMSDTPLPLPELAIVNGVSDSKLLTEAANDYFEATSTIATTLSELFPEKVPPIPLPRPETRDLETGKLYYYQIPPMVGLNDKIAPNAALSDDTLILSLVPEATERLLASTSLDIAGSSSRYEGPLATAWHFGFADLIKTARPWVDYGFQIAAEQGEADEETVSQVRTVLDVLQCFDGMSGVSYVNGDAMTTHYESRFHDLD